ncbi:MobA/MobL family protein, partial [Shewanella electrodiphila]
EVRQLWEQLANEKLAEHKHDLIDCRSYADQGKDIEPQLKMGSVATKLERDAYEKAKTAAKEKGEVFNGIAPVTIRGEINAMIAERNSLVLEASNKIIFERENRDRIDRVNRTLGEITDKIKYTESVIDRTQRVIDENAVRTRDAESANDWAAKRCENLPKRIDEITDKHERVLSVGEWAAERCKNLPKRSDETKQRVTNSKSEASRIHNSITERAKPAPSPFDNKYERAFFERKRRIDRAIRETDRKLDGSKLGDVQRSNDVKDAAKTLAYILLDRHTKGRFDKRQLTVLDDFAKKLGINENQGSDFRQNVRLATDKINTVKVLENNPHVFHLLNFPSQEREHYQTVTADFDRFIVHIDKQRAELRQKYQSKLGKNDTSRVTAEILTVEPYLAALTKYTNNSEKTDESRALAEQHINKTLRLTAKQYKIAYEGLNTLSSTESAQKHAKELGDSLSSFTTDYAEKLTEVDLRSINEGLKVIDRGIEISNTSQSRNNLSPDF